MATDPTQLIREAATAFPGIDQATACTQSAFKLGKQAYLYIGPQGGRFKAMFKLSKSLAQAEQLAEEFPERFEVGPHGWVTARFSEAEPLPKKIWGKWLKESFQLAAAKQTSKSPRKKQAAPGKTTKKAVKKKSTSGTTKRTKSGATSNVGKSAKKSSAKKSPKKSTRRKS